MTPWYQDGLMVYAKKLQLFCLVLFLSVEELFDFLDGKVVGGFQGSDTGACDVRHVFVFHFLKILHVEHGALFVWQCSDGCV
jgi:hypothetical protein